jgi:hypothetical protein
MSATHTHRAQDTGMDSALRAAIEERPVVNISTHGCKSGAPRRIEIRIRHADARISQRSPGQALLYANLRANPQLTLDRAREATDHDTAEQREVLSRIASPNDLDAWIEGSPLVQLTEV